MSTATTATYRVTGQRLVRPQILRRGQTTIAVWRCPSGTGLDQVEVLDSPLRRRLGHRRRKPVARWMQTLERAS